MDDETRGEVSACFELYFEFVDLDKSTEERGLGLASLGPLICFSYTTVADTPPLVSKEMRIGLWQSPQVFFLIHPVNLEHLPWELNKLILGLASAQCSFHSIFGWAPLWPKIIVGLVWSPQDHFSFSPPFPAHTSPTKFISFVTFNCFFTILN